jgi:hypothetical protein
MSGMTVAQDQFNVTMEADLLKETYTLDGMLGKVEMTISQFTFD